MISDWGDYLSRATGLEDRRLELDGDIIVAQRLLLNCGRSFSELAAL
jgi:hypothetical protein